MPTLNVTLTEPLAQFVLHQVEIGNYQNASELVREALRLLRHEKEVEAARLEVLKREVARGLTDAENGRFSTRSLDDIADAVLQDARAAR